MARKYNPHAIEAKWQARWPKERQSWQLNPGDEKYYCLDMFSYPSGEGLHMGHWRPYTITDVWSRYQTMKGKKVLHPVGFDAFGLPAENAAIKTKTHPAEYTEKSIANFKRQIQEAGFLYDWSTETITSSPEYYRWTQWLFLQLYKAGLAYRKSAPVNWCPSCQTVLANEQVIGGRCERCQTEVIKKELRQWFFRITDFAEELLNFDTSEWPERVKTLQTAWIGKSEGADIRFDIDDLDETLSIFTTRPDTLLGVTYLVIAPEHARLDHLVTEAQALAVQGYVDEAKKKSDIDRLAATDHKTGVFTGRSALHPITNQKIPIWVADYVIGGYGTGAVMGVPAHDTRDFVFAKDYELPIVFVVEPVDQPLDTAHPFTDFGRLVNSGQFDGLVGNEAIQVIVETLATRQKGNATTHYRLRDWLISRQRYWGAPIPIVYCQSCGEQPVDESDLPILLPRDVEFIPTGGSPLERHESFKDAPCPKCGGTALRETDTLDTFVDSSWYFLRYTDPKNREKAFDSEQVKRWLPVDLYVGGIEHAILHLLYARFMMKAFHRLDLVPYDEPFKRFYGNGMIYLHGSKMSKSKGNIVNPDDMVKKHGVDALRGYILFMGPADQDVEWQENGIMGVRRFLEKAWVLFHHVSDDGATSVDPAVEQAYQSINELLPELHFNRCVSTLMIAVNALGGKQLSQHEASILIKLFAPIFPHFAEEIWAGLGHATSIFIEAWPQITVAASPTTTYVIQMNGKVRGTLKLDRGRSESDVVAQAKQFLDDKALLADKSIIKTIFVPGRIVNFVVK